MAAKKHKHLIAKILLVIGLLDVLAFLVLVSAYGVGVNFSFIVRVVLWVVLPVLFIAGVFDKKQEPEAKQATEADWQASVQDAEERQKNWWKL